MNNIIIILKAMTSGTQIFKLQINKIFVEIITVKKMNRKNMKISTADVLKRKLRKFVQ